jgi:hypothetical protein
MSTIVHVLHVYNMTLHMIVIRVINAKYMDDTGSRHACNVML